MHNSYDSSAGHALAAAYPDLPLELTLRVYTSRLLGLEEELVLHGGGNTSVKRRERNVLGDEIDVLYVKGSGIDLTTMEPSGFTRLKLAELRRLKELTGLTDHEMDNQLRTNKLDADAPDPSLDTLVHAFLPHRYVDHTHADSILILTNQEEADRHLRRALGSNVLIIPYVHPGYPLARAVIQAYEEHPEADAAVVKGHGIFTFSDDLKTAYDHMIAYVTQAEDYIGEWICKGNSCPSIEVPAVPYSYTDLARLTQTLRGHCAYQDDQGRTRRFFVEVRDGREMSELSLLPEARDFCLSGAITPDHVIRTKNEWIYLDHLPVDDEALTHLVEVAVRNYIYRYDEYTKTQLENQAITTDLLDPYPRVFLVAGLGVAALGETRKAARIAADIAEHTLRAKALGLALGPFAPLCPSDVFQMEYWDRQQKKLGAATPPPLQGQAALVTGGAGAIAFGIADRLLNAGAVVALADIDRKRLKIAAAILAERYGSEQVETLAFDVTQYPAVETALEDFCLRFGGLDLLVPNAGLAHVAKIEDLEPEQLDRTMAVNYKGAFNVIKAAIPVFRRQKSGGNIVLISSKNVFDPGASFTAYSASKAAAHQLAKIAALEMAELGVRVNMINPDAVFGTGHLTSKLWDMVGPDRMRSRGLKPEDMQEYYRTRNLLKSQVTAEHVGNAVVFFASYQTPTTGATLPVDGGVQNAFPR